MCGTNLAVLKGRDLVRSTRHHTVMSIGVSWTQPLQIGSGNITNWHLPFQHMHTTPLPWHSPEHSPGHVQQLAFIILAGSVNENIQRPQQLEDTYTAARTSHATALHS